MSNWGSLEGRMGHVCCPEGRTRVQCPVCGPQVCWQRAACLMYMPLVIQCSFNCRKWLQSSQHFSDCRKWRARRRPCYYKRSFFVFLWYNATKSTLTSQAGVFQGDIVLICFFYFHWNLVSPTFVTVLVLASFPNKKYVYSHAHTHTHTLC